MRLIKQSEAEEMREALKTIAAFFNPAQERDSGQAAAELARKTLEGVGLFSQEEAQVSGHGISQGPSGK